MLSELTRQGAPGCLSSHSSSPGSVHLNSRGWTQQSWFLRSEDFPSCADIIPSLQTISKKPLSLLALLLLLYWFLFTLDIGGLFLERIQIYRKNNNLLAYKEYKTWRWGYFLSIASGIKVTNFILVFLGTYNENDKKNFTWVYLKNELHNNKNFSVSHK